ncbi:thiol reductase thioredoxin [Thermus thermophilus]|uniref:thioredoxin family protein n=1 Tax=Thermus thermophilus TaxID=274 RepID=UPI001FCB85A1|nr:thioredoxin family protein [Thermus thermophilus]BDG18502.1 thiol reductase thioredoxin [Thermus thermophilus]
MLEARYLEGLTYEGLLPRLWRNRDRVEAFYAGLPPLPPLPRAQRALALVEDWCPDSVQAIPVLARLPLEVRFFFRDENPDLAEAYAREGKRIVPTVVFLDGAYGELARWHGPPEAARAFLREKKAEGLSPKALLLAYHRAFSRFAEAMLAEWRTLLSP